MGKGKERRRRNAKLRKSCERKLCKMMATNKRAHDQSITLAAGGLPAPQAMRNKCVLSEPLYIRCSFIEPKLTKTELVEEIVKVISMRSRRDGCS